MYMYVLKVGSRDPREHRVEVLFSNNEADAK